MYEMMTGQFAFQESDRVVDEEPVRLPQSYSEELRLLIWKMLRKDPTLRPTAQNILD